MSNPRSCSVDGCSGKYKGLGYCVRHYQQVRKNGRIMSNSVNTKSDPNNFVLDGGVCSITLRDIYGNEVGIATVDAEDYDKVKLFKWHLLSTGYVFSDGAGLLHRFVFSSNKQVDHKDRNPLHNCKSNLREASRKQNSTNAEVRKTNTSGYKGVSLCKSTNKWMSKITHNGQQIYLGYFGSVIEAAKAYNEKALELFGEFACLNKI